MSLTENIVSRIESGETTITINVGTRDVARKMAADLRRWWEREKSPDGADSEAVSDNGRTEVQGWSDWTQSPQTVDWRVILLTVD